MKKYIICSFCFTMIICVAYTFSFNQLSTQTADKDTINPVDNFEDRIKSDSILIIEECKINTHGDSKFERSQFTMPSLYLGMTRSEIQMYLKDYMENLSINDLENGLTNYDLIYFSTNCVILRKTYNLNDDYCKYFIKFCNGCITVFYSDQKTIYEYTTITLEDLPSKIAADILIGIRIKNEKELYDFLENYSS